MWRSLSFFVAVCALAMPAFGKFITIDTLNYRDETTLREIMLHVDDGLGSHGEVLTVDAERVAEVIALANTKMAEYNERSVRRNREFGGVIYAVDGVLMSTVKAGDAFCSVICSVDLSGDYNQLLHRAKTENIVIYADWHTHGKSAQGFSKGDRKGLVATSRVLQARGHPFIGCFFTNATHRQSLVTMRGNDRFAQLVVGLGRQSNSQS